MKATLLLRRSAALVFALATTATLPAVSAASDIEEIVVTADFRGRAESELPASLSLIDGAGVEGLAIQHFEELVNVVPNLNWSGDGHRARYLQIRGVGELEQYQGAPNPSVGFVVDDIDFSGIGTIATLFDIERVEVLRGSQGSRYGANALAGLVYLQSTLPAAERNGRLQLAVGSDDTLSAGLAFGGAIAKDERALFRLSGHHHRSNGFRDNTFLDREDTNGRDETTVRGRITLLPTDTLEVRLAAIYSDVDDGYDAFALDNSYTVLSDRPGRDAQESLGASLRLDWDAWQPATLTSITAYADSDIDFGFDADWGNPGSWAPFSYDFVSANQRKRRTLSQELRVVSTGDRRVNWLAGLYALRLEDDLDTLNAGEYVDPLAGFADTLVDRFGSDYEATNLALFGQLDIDVGEATRLGVGLRVERRRTDYTDTAGLVAGPGETMTGGELTLSHDHSDSLTGFVSLSKGFKAGGFNLGLVPAERRAFSGEQLWTVEAGFKSSWMDSSLAANVSLFVSRRDDQQVRTSLQLVPGDPTTFVFLTDNAARGETVGFEAELRWFPGERWEIYTNLGLLDARFDRYLAPQGDLSGRDQAHAPGYTLALGGVYRRPNGFFARIDASAKDDFYFDVSHNQRSDAYELVHARVGLQTDAWLLQLWGRNLFDTRYSVRGFYFGNEPPDFPNTLYTRAGDRRQFGVTLERRF